MSEHGTFGDKIRNAVDEICLQQIRSNIVTQYQFHFGKSVNGLRPLSNDIYRMRELVVRIEKSSDDEVRAVFENSATAEWLVAHKSIWAPLRKYERASNQTPWFHYNDRNDLAALVLGRLTHVDRINEMTKAGLLS